MNYFIYTAFLLYSMSSFSQSKTTISKDVEAGATDTQNAPSIIEATNSIERDATVVYKAGESIVLNEGFFADLDSNVFMAIEEPETTSFKSLQESNLLLDESNLLTGEFMAYPNPSNGLFTVQGSDIITVYSINNVIGKQVLLEKVSNINTINIDISTFASGVYFIELQKENGEIIRRKIIKN